jgi:hypothetical protein
MERVDATQMNHISPSCSVTMHLRCPECHDAEALACQVEATGHTVTVSLLSQACLCDPFHDWEDVWEQAREAIDGMEDAL